MNRSSDSRPSSLLLHALLGGALVMSPACGKKEDASPGATEPGTSSGTPSAPGTSSKPGASASAKAPDPADLPLDHPAKGAEAALRIDFSTFPMMDGSEDKRQRSMTSFNGRFSSDVKTAYAFQQKNLLARGWKELPGSTVTNEYGSGTFSRAGFHVSVMVMPSSESGQVDVMLQNHGNIDFAKLPLPSSAKAVYVGPVSAIYAAETSVAATDEECQKLFLAAGWQLYGREGDMKVYKKNAVTVKTFITPAPAQGGKTNIQYSSEQLPDDVPMMPGADRFRYLGSTGRFEFDTTETEDAVSTFYRQGLAQQGWQATMDKTIEIGGKNMVIFRNGPKDMLTLEMKTEYGKTRVALFHQTAAEVANMDRRLNAQMEARKAKMKAEAAKPAVVFVPAGATVVSQTSNEIKFTMSAGTARALAQTWSDKYNETGWQLERGGYEGGKGRWAFKREGQTLVFVYTDEGGAPAEVIVTSTGVGLEKAAGQ